MLLMVSGYRLIGVFMRNWDERDETGVCTSARDFQEVERVCGHMESPVYRWTSLRSTGTRCSG